MQKADKKKNDSKMTQENIDKVIYLNSMGWSDSKIAEAIGVNRSTIFRWKKANPSILQQIEAEKLFTDDLVEKALLKRALGYEYQEEKAFCFKGEIVTAKVTKHQAPDVTAQLAWLYNRQPEKWKRNLVDSPISTAVMNTSTKVSFYEFCVKAGYPEPFEKQTEMREFALAFDDPHMILGSRGYGKTDYVTILGMAYEIYLDPQFTVLIVTKSEDRNTAIIKEIEKALQANGVTIEKSNTTTLRVKGLLGKDPNVGMITIGSTGVRGRHPKMVLMDDPVTPDDVSEATRKKVKRLYEELIKLTNKVLLIGQPVHKLDLYEELRPLIPVLEVPHGTIPELDPDLEAQKMAGVSEESISASYHLKVISENPMPFEDINTLEAWIGGETVAFIDPSFKGGDFTAISIGRAHFDGVAIQGFAWKKSWDNCLEYIVEAVKTYKIKRLCFETNSLGDMPLTILREILAPFGCGVVGRHSNGNKHSRIMSAGVHSHNLYLSPDCNKAYHDQVKHYEYGVKNDDAPDSLASLLDWVGLIRGK